MNVNVATYIKRIKRVYTILSFVKHLGFYFRHVLEAYTTTKSIDCCLLPVPNSLYFTTKTALHWQLKSALLKLPGFAQEECLELE